MYTNNKCEVKIGIKHKKSLHTGSWGETGMQLKPHPLESVIEPIALYGCEVWGLLTNQDFTKWDKHQIEILHAEFCKNILCVV